MVETAPIGGHHEYMDEKNPDKCAGSRFPSGYSNDVGFCYLHFEDGKDWTETDDDHQDSTLCFRIEMTTPEMTPLSPNFHATPEVGRLAITYDLACSSPIHGGSSVESGFEPGALRPEGRGLTTRRQRPTPFKKT
ncbi:hypothetical protein AVEN_17087-1 [Araneus ventricosus]|uniref:Uncharacterized protein n=1 Tax=Araneus ventricosus TaxID=182803 RepID=A0A4Y2PGF0_ARAVE|nr:hypothetical protein AVEN_17087-1 [Araneus ventricosus]